jgi:hypothetical protein
MYAHVYAHMHTYTHAYILSISARAHIYACMRTYGYLCAYTRICIRVCMYACMCERMYTCMFVCMCGRVCMAECMCRCVQCAYISVYTCTVRIAYEAQGFAQYVYVYMYSGKYGRRGSVVLSAALTRGRCMRT